MEPSYRTDIQDLEVILRETSQFDEKDKKELLNALESGKPIGSCLPPNIIDNLKKYRQLKDKVVAIFSSSPSQFEIYLIDFFDNLKVSSLNNAWKTLISKIPPDLKSNLETNIYPDLAAALNQPITGVCETHRLKSLEIKDSKLIQYDYGVDHTAIELGRGSFGSVLKGRFKGCPAAIKKLQAQSSDFSKEDYIKECNIMADFTSPNIIKIYGYILSPYDCRIVMEYAELGSLTSFYKKNKDLTLIERIKIAKGVALGLNVLHIYNIVHRDIKACNVLLGEGLVPKLCDFGLAKKRGLNETNPSQKSLAKGDIGVGTIKWMAPELFSPLPKYNKASDIFALGILFWTLTTLNNPFQGVTLNLDFIEEIKRGLREKIPEEFPGLFKDLIKRCWAHSPEERPNIFEVVEVLEKCEQAYDQHPINPINQAAQVPANNMQEVVRENNDETLQKKIIVKPQVKEEYSEFLAMHFVEEEKWNVFYEYEETGQLLCIINELNNKEFEINSDYYIIVADPNFFDDEVMTIIFKQVNLMKQLEKLIFNFSKFTKISEITINLVAESIIGLNMLKNFQLELGKEAISESGLKYFLEILERITEIEHLELTFRNIGFGGVFLIYLSQAIRKLKKLKFLSINLFSSCSEEIINGVDIFIEHIKELSLCDTLILYLGFNKNNLNGEHLIKIGNEIQSLKNIQNLTLGLQEWDINDQKLMEFAKIISGIMTLKFLKLWTCSTSITETGKYQFKAFLSKIRVEFDN